MAWISFKFYKNYYYFLIFWILELGTSIIKYFFDENSTYNNIDYSRDNEYFHLIELNISDLLAGFFVLFTEMQMKTQKTEEVKKSKNTQELIYNDYSIKRNKFVYVFIISIFNFLGSSIEYFYYLISDTKLKKENFEWLISVDIITRIIFSKIILKTRLYKHHIISLIIFVIGFLPLTLCGFINSLNFYILLVFFRNVLYALGDIFSKILLTKKFVLPQYLIFWKGIFIFVIHIILFIILYPLGKIDFDYFSFYKTKKILLGIVSILTLLPKNLCVMKVIYLFTPQHVGFLNVVVSLKNYGLYISNRDEKIASEIIITVLSFFVVIFGTLIFNEMIIINIFELDKGTKPGIIQREKIEMDTSILEEDLRNEEELEQEQEQDEIKD